MDTSKRAWLALHMRDGEGGVEICLKETTTLSGGMGEIVASRPAPNGIIPDLRSLSQGIAET